MGLTRDSILGNFSFYTNNDVEDYIKILKELDEIHHLNHKNDDQMFSST